MLALKATAANEQDRAQVGGFGQGPARGDGRERQAGVCGPRLPFAAQEVRCVHQILNGIPEMLRRSESRIVFTNRTVERPVPTARLEFQLQASGLARGRLAGLDDVQRNLSGSE